MHTCMYSIYSLWNFCINCIWSQSEQMYHFFVKFLSSYQSQTAWCLWICCVSAVELSDFATFAIFDVSVCVRVLAKLGLVWTGGELSGCAKEVPIRYAMGIGGASFVKARSIYWLCCPCSPAGHGARNAFVQSIKKWLSPLSRAVRSTYLIRHWLYHSWGYGGISVLSGTAMEARLPDIW